MGRASYQEQRPSAAVIPLRAPRARDGSALDRALATPAGRGRAVLVAAHPGGDPLLLLRGARGRSFGPVRCVVVGSGAPGAEALAARILEGQSSTPPRSPRAVLRAWAAHLASQGRELSIALADAGSLSSDAASWLGGLVRASRGAVRVIVPWTEDPRIGRVVEALGLETRVVGDPVPPAHPAGAAARAPEPAGGSPSAAELRRGGWRTRANWLAAGLACLGLLPAWLWLVSADRGGVRYPGAEAAPAVRTRPAAPALPASPAAVAPEPDAARFAYDPASDSISFAVRGEPLAGVLAELSAQLGFEVRNLTSDPLSEPVHLAVEQVPLEEALRRLLRHYSKSFVYASSTPAEGAPRLRTLIVLPPPQRSSAAPRPAASSSGATPAATLPEGPPGSRGIALEVEAAIAALMADDVDGRHEAAIERLLALDPVAVAEEAVRQFDALTPVGPLAPMQVDAAWERLRAALCPSGDRVALPSELGCRPSSNP